MTEKKRYGVGSLEEEIRTIQKMVAEGHDFSETGEIVEAFDLTEAEVLESIQGATRVKGNKKNQMAHQAIIKMLNKAGRLSFRVSHLTLAGKGDWAETVDAKKLAGMLA